MVTRMARFKRNDRVLYLGGQKGWLSDNFMPGMWTVRLDNGITVVANERKEIAHVSKNVPAERRLEVD